MWDEILSSGVAQAGDSARVVTAFVRMDFVTGQTLIGDGGTSSAPSGNE